MPRWRRRVIYPLPAVIAFGARGLQEAGGGDSQDESRADHEPWLPSRHVLDLREQLLSVALREVAADTLEAIRALVGDPGVASLLLVARLAQLDRRLPEGLGDRLGLFARLSRAHVDLRAQRAPSLVDCVARLLLGNLSGRIDYVSHLRLRVRVHRFSNLSS